MNRPIKFRVWDFTIKRFDTQIYQVGEQFGHPSSCDWIAQQYTGLNDKNGKEIYEGDIIHLKFGELNANLVVKWDKYMGLKYHNGGWTSMVHVDTHGEVIGNIFENPELLK